MLSNDLLPFSNFNAAVTNLLNNESVSDIDCLRLVMLYALHYEKESPVQLMQLFNKLASRSAKYKPWAVTNLLNNESVSDIDRLRLVMLYTLRYEKESPVQLMQLFNKLASRSAKYKPGLVQFVLKQARVEKRTGDLFGNRDLLNIARNMARGLKGVENVYTQHQPLLFQTMESISKGRLRDVDYPYVGNHFQQGRPQEVVIFIVGGTTYEESRFVALQNASNSGIRFILGGSVVLNSKSTGKIVNEYWEEELDDHQNQPTFPA
ncbi:vacuolar protein sorting-associated protein 45 like protein [Quercus suber]|uniref:Vacuolar protein sorting-associated protein 45 like protein n=1 Tax=Quercus suber TaxID=58331 RepID=A0AAW0KSX4_QUESU